MNELYYLLPMLLLGGPITILWMWTLGYAADWWRWPFKRPFFD